jgi:hypothetical protein
MRRLLLASIALVAVLCAPAGAGAATYDVDKVLGDDVDRLAPSIDVPIRLPDEIELDYDRGIFGDGIRTPDGYDFDINATRECGGNACFLAQFAAEENGSLAFLKKVDLAKGKTGRYKPLSCGASCSPPQIRWRQGGVVYSIQAKLGVSGRKRQRRAMVRLANQSIRATPQ